MSDLRRQVIEDLSALAALLEKPFPSALSNEGWSVELWQKCGRIFGGLLESVRAGSLGTDTSISRSMDFNGIIQGEVLEKAAAISNSLRELGRNA